MILKIERIIPLLLFLIHSLNGQHDLNQWPNRSVIVQLFEWKFEDIARECENVLGPKGYGAVQVSPVAEHVSEANEWRDRYQPISYKIQTRLGNADEFLDMSRRCNAQGVRIYVDVVLNHMAKTTWQLTVTGTANSSANPKKYSYPAVPYKYGHFNTPCEIINWGDANDLRNCQLWKMADLNYNKKYVEDKAVAFLNQLIDMGAGGFRIDAAKHMWPTHLEAIQARLNNLSTDFGFKPNSRPFIINDLVDFGSDHFDVGRWEYAYLGMITDFLVPGELGRAFRGVNDLKYLQNWGPQWGFLPSMLAIVFLQDHEIHHGVGLGGADSISWREPKVYKMANAFMLAHPFGVPRILSTYKFYDEKEGPPEQGRNGIASPGAGIGDCFNGWNCEHRWRAVANMAKFRNEADGTLLNNWWSQNKKQIAFSRGENAFIVWNGHDSIDLRTDIQTCLPPGTYCDIISGDINTKGKCTGMTIQIDDSGIGHFTIPADSNDGVIAIHVGATLENVCRVKSLGKILQMFWATNCYRNSKIHIGSVYRAQSSKVNEEI